MMEAQRYQKYLCCVGASVLLNIVTNHEIHFNYQEVAIIKKFNQALQNTEVLDLDEIESSAGDQESVDVIHEEQEQTQQIETKNSVDESEEKKKETESDDLPSIDKDEVSPREPKKKSGPAMRFQTQTDGIFAKRKDLKASMVKSTT